MLCFRQYISYQASVTVNFCLNPNLKSIYGIFYEVFNKPLTLCFIYIKIQLVPPHMLLLVIANREIIGFWLIYSGLIVLQ